jgi:hypothetical protein
MWPIVLFGIAAIGGIVYYKSKQSAAASSGDADSALPNIPGVTPDDGGGGSGTPIPAGQTATVTTSDPAPSGDLIIRSQPSDTAPQTGGAEKNGVVTIVNWDASPTYAQIQWPGGSRLPPANGFAHKAYLTQNFSS